jgi:hypothetical protein
MADRWIDLIKAIERVYTARNGTFTGSRMAFIQACADGLIATRWRGHHLGHKPSIPSQDWVGAEIDVKAGRVLKADGNGMMFVDVNEPDLTAWLAPQGKSDGRKRGRKEKTIWPRLEKRAHKIMENEGRFDQADPKWDCQERLVEKLLKEFEVGRSTLLKRLPGILSRWRTDESRI